MQAIEREILFDSWMTVLVVIAIIMLSLMKMFNPKKLAGYTFSFFTKGFMVKRAAENVSYFSFFHMLLVLFSSLVLSLFFYLQMPLRRGNLYDFSIINTFIISFISFRIFTDILLSKILGVFNEVRYFLLTKVGYLYALCLWLFPAIIIRLYAYENNTVLFVFFTLLVALRFVLILVNNKKLILSQLFYFILYLCTLEIAPLFILYKLTIK
ncbi:conserved membrane hypothetical protein [Tenacibaculum maritimum]|nr:conserved membrane hypothetical protein [Tenacibaculum maritimum]CAA0227276.1 conserved membrane hypothetical protein [Tenacibaculum maritimum]